MKDLIDKDAKFYNTISFDIAQKKMKDEELINFLCQLGFYELKSNELEDQIRKLNPSKYNTADSVYDFFASIQFEGKCYLVTKDYLDEETALILKTIIKVGEENLKNNLKQYQLKNEYFLDIEEHKAFYRVEYDKLVKTAINIRNKFGENVFDTVTKIFSDTVIAHIKTELHSCSSYNLNYITGNDLGLDFKGSNCFLDLLHIVRIERQIDYVREQLLKTSQDISNTETYSTQEIVCFFDVMNMIDHEGEKSFRKQAKLISKLTGKHERNIREKIARIGNKDYKKQVLETNQKIFKDLDELGYPLGPPQG